ncbi:short-chain dehydrogenase [Actinocatenispora thailandica]|uniref:Short-chain dehydrogenase n=1 Tax=Actinocatenispora thailandica TaxID=227318 RepID=A0A7R7DN45_9ACTN|nr:SDR family oxidoreductase [Actinocatenispora thailandica]BCJ34754.1 short-chain dehydrogenase [Actinocatenispora thailandica]
MSLTGQRALVMGGSSGIGAATAELFAQQGADVVITGRDETRLAAVADRIGGTAHRLDATDPDLVAGFFTAPDEYDHLVLALSGAAGAGPFATLDLSALRDGFERKFWAHLGIAQAALPRLRGSITFLTAASARAALPGTAGLAAINGALEAMIRPLAVELAPLRVNAVSPGIIRTPWWDQVPEAVRDEMFAAQEKTLPVGRIGAAGEVAQAVLTLATNGFVTGSVLEVAGGVHLASGR